MRKSLELRTLLRRARMKATPGHLAIMAFFCNSKKPVSSQDAIDHLGNKLDPATVYRGVAKLKEAGLIRQIDLRANHAHYEFFDMGHHHHIICTKCGRIEDIEECDLEVIQNQILKQAKQFSKVQHHSLEFYGLCKKCS